MHVGSIGLNPKCVKPWIGGYNDVAGRCCACDSRTAASTTPTAASTKKTSEDSAAAQNTGSYVAENSTAATTASGCLTGDDTLDQLGRRRCFNVLQDNDGRFRRCIGQLFLSYFIQLIELPKCIRVVAGNDQTVWTATDNDFVKKSTGRLSGCCRSYGLSRLSVFAFLSSSNEFRKWIDRTNL